MRRKREARLCVNKLLMCCCGGCIVLIITGGQVSCRVEPLWSSVLLRRKGRVDLFLGKFFFYAGRKPDMEQHGTLRVLQFKLQDWLAVIIFNVCVAFFPLQNKALTHLLLHFLPKQPLRLAVISQISRWGNGGLESKHDLAQTTWKGGDETGPARPVLAHQDPPTRVTFSHEWSWPLPFIKHLPPAGPEGRLGALCAY